MTPYRFVPRTALVFLGVLVLPTTVSAADGEGKAAGARPHPHILVAYYSLTGNTEQMARGVAEGIGRVPGVTAVVKKVDEVTKQDL